MPSTARLPHQAHSVTLSAKSCRDGARGLGTPAAASETRAGSLMIEGDFRSLFRDRQAGEGGQFRALGPGEDPARTRESRSAGEGRRLGFLSEGEKQHVGHLRRYCLRRFFGSAFRSR